PARPDRSRPGRARHPHPARLACRRLAAVDSCAHADRRRRARRGVPCRDGLHGRKDPRRSEGRHKQRRARFEHRPGGRVQCRGARVPRAVGLKRHVKMTDGSASRTALSTALMRAVHTRIDRPRLIDDPWGDTLVPAVEKTALYRRILAGAGPEARTRLEGLRSAQAVIDPPLDAPPPYGGVVVRTRYAEDALKAAVASGVRQYVLIGAGFDSFVIRQPLFARGIEIFEIDHPATQAMKRTQLEACGAAVPPNVRF